MKKALYLSLLLIVSVSLSSCGGNEGNKEIKEKKNVSVNENGDKLVNDIKVDGKLKEENNKSDNEEKKKVDEKKVEKQIEETKKMYKKKLESLNKIKDEREKRTILTNLKYNKHLLSKEDQKKLDKLIKKETKKDIKQLKNEISPIKDKKEKERLNKLIERMASDGSLEDYEKDIIRSYVNYGKKDMERDKKMIKNLIKNIDKSPKKKVDIKKTIEQIKNITKEADKKLFRNVKQIDNIDKQKFIKIIDERLKELEKRTNAIINEERKKGTKVLSYSDFLKLKKLAKRGSVSFKLKKKIDLEGNFAIKRLAGYVNYNEIKVDVYSIYKVNNTLKELGQYGVNKKKVKILLYKDGFIKVNLDREYLDHLKAKKLLEENPGIINLVINVYGLDKNASPETVVNNLINLVTGKYVDYTNVKDYKSFQKLMMLFSANQR